MIGVRIDSGFHFVIMMTKLILQQAATHQVSL